MNSRIFSYAVFFVFGFACFGLGAEIQIQEGWHSVFGGQDAVFHVVVSAEDGYQGRLFWQLAAGQGVISRGERGLNLSNNQKAVEKIILRIPPVRPGIQVPLVWSFSLENEQANITRTLHVFHEDPFDGRLPWLEELNIHLFDPEGRTADRFDEQKIPYEWVRDIDPPRHESGQLVIIGEGVRLDDYPVLMEQMLLLIEKDVPVLLLAPQDGRLLIPGGEELPVHPDYVYWKNEQAVLELNKGLDAYAWPDNGRAFDKAFVVRSDRNQVVAEVKESPLAWPWMEAGIYGEAQLVLCAYPVIERWDDGPTPRHLLKSLLEFVVSGKGDLK